MYCILNQSNDIIASDLEFLELFGTNSLVDLYKKITAEDTKISLDYDKITITINNSANNYDIKVTPLATLFGKSVLVELMSESIKNEFIKAPAFVDEAFKHVTSTNTAASVNIPQETVEQDMTPEKSQNEEISDEKEVVVEPVQTKDHTQPLVEPEITEDIGIQESEPKEVKMDESIEYFINPNITLDIPNIAKSMHLSEYDYCLFLNEYTSSIDKFKNDLEGDNENAKNNAISFIKHITTALNLPKEIEDLVHSLKVDSSKELIQNFYDVVENIKKQNSLFWAPSKEEVQPKIAPDETVQKPTNEEITILPIHEEPININIAQQKPISNEIQIEPAKNTADLSEINIQAIELETPKYSAASEEQKREATDKISTNVKIDLENVKPSPFDFILDESAKELSLPADIVKEFIRDFIEQCHMDTNQIIHKYEEGDIEKIKKLAHSLKGVASNLYILPLADTLLELQNNDDLSKVKPLVEKYWGQFLYLENIMKNI